ncbi:MAG: CHAT domain-containing protein, partial [Acidobacteriota bacterium]|nr:CHAT domain-containing protein [Acidobacteriota bacterium]
LETQDGRYLAALQASERARSRVLLDILTAGPEQVDRAMTDAEQNEERSIRARISTINASLATAKPGGTAAAAKNRDAAWHDYETFLAALYVRHPELRTWRGDSPVVSERELVSLVPDGKTALVEYLSDEDETLMFVVTRDSSSGIRVTAHRIAMGRGQLGRETAAFRNLLEMRDPGFRASARSLYDALPGAAAELRGKSRIYLVPDGPLWGMPFQALLSPANRYWVEDATISYAPSLTFLRDQVRSATETRTFSLDLFAMGDPARAETPSIPSLREQISEIGALYGGGSRVSLRVGADATETAFKQMAPSARVIQIAAHGEVDGRNALHSRVILASSGAAERREDGWVEAWEIMRMNLNADLAVLSACETGRGQAAGGEGLLGLEWALFVSGVRTAIVSQWRVESESTAGLMVGLHRRLRDGEAPAQALRGSVLALMKNPRYRHPMYWAGFVSAGLR